MDKIERFGQIMDEIRELNREAINLVPIGFHHNRAYAYWYGQINTAIDGNSMCSMEQTLGSIPEEEGSDET